MIKPQSVYSSSSTGQGPNHPDQVFKLPELSSHLKNDKMVKTAKVFFSRTAL